MVYYFHLIYLEFMYMKYQSIKWVSRLADMFSSSRPSHPQSSGMTGRLQRY